MENAFCQTCTARTCLNTNKPCEEIEKLLPSKNKGRYWKEFPTDNIEEVAIKRAFELKYGKRKPKSPSED